MLQRGTREVQPGGLPQRTTPPCFHLHVFNWLCSTTDTQVHCIGYLTWILLEGSVEISFSRHIIARNIRSLKTANVPRQILPDLVDVHGVVPNTERILSKAFEVRCQLHLGQPDEEGSECY